MPTIIGVLGRKKSGKTTVAESLIGELTRKGFEVAAVKHISEPEFTIDCSGKDSDRFAKAGATKVLVMSSKEIATVEKTNLEYITLDEIAKRCENSDIVIIEGFEKLIGRDTRVEKIVTIKNADEALSAQNEYKPIIAFSGRYSTMQLRLNAPYVDVSKNPKKLSMIVEDYIRNKEK